MNKLNNKIALFVFVFVIFTIQSCGIFMVGSGTKINKDEINVINFCDLEKYNGKLIKTKLEYSSFEEYSSARSFTNCPLDDKVYLDFSEFDYNWRDIFIRGQFKKLNKYYKYKAKMTVIGIFEIDSVKGFGHLNSKISRILVKKVKIRVVKKHKNKENG